MVEEWCWFSHIKVFHEYFPSRINVLFISCQFDIVHKHQRCCWCAMIKRWRLFGHWMHHVEKKRVTQRLERPIHVRLRQNDRSISAWCRGGRWTWHRRWGRRCPCWRETYNLRNESHKSVHVGLRGRRCQKLLAEWWGATFPQFASR